MSQEALGVLHNYQIKLCYNKNKLRNLGQIYYMNLRQNMEYNITLYVKMEQLNSINFV